ncbi:hypothetical protein DKX38_015379 [Salix brachista]|uniref:Uncharacterized protein n=1 Tax=Salix brachista TaxID=2182728 RepID=A0A5N5L719_9ROSI|nr:hypothetical protein DKX38_015379 [Salix brachista]
MEISSAFHIVSPSLVITSSALLSLHCSRQVFHQLWFRHQQDCFWPELHWGLDVKKLQLSCKSRMSIAGVKSSP